MIPLFVILDVRGRRSLRLWLPLFLAWLFLLPIVLVALPFALVALLVARINPWPAIAAFWGVLAGTRGTHVEVATRDGSVLVHIY
jgi:hypothetical protein